MIVKTYAIVATRSVQVPQIDGSTATRAAGQVINLILWDGVAEYPVEDGCQLTEVRDGWGIAADGTLQDLRSAPTP